MSDSAPLRRPLVSIITVARNSAATIQDTCRSVAEQTWPRIEHILIDGDSSDDTVVVARQTGRADIRVLSESDGGIYDAMNKGIRLARGEIIGFLNADDFYADPNAIAKVADLMNRTGANCCYGDLVYVDKNRPSRIIRDWKSRSYADGLFEMGWHPPHPTFFVNREVYERYGGFDTSFTISADYELMLRMLNRYGITSVYLPRILVKMRTGGASGRNLREIVRANIECYRAWKKNGLKISPAIALRKPLSKLAQYRLDPPVRWLRNGVGKLVRANKWAADQLTVAFPTFFGGGNYQAVLQSHIDSCLKQRPDMIRILEAGGIDRPLLRKQPRRIYDGLDIEEKPACNSIYDHFFVQPIETAIHERYDLILSITLLEHVRDNAAAMRTMYRALNEGGTVLHYLPSRYHPYSLLLQLLGPYFQRKLIHLLRPWAADVTGYPAYFHHCSPKAMSRVMRQIGYRNVTTLCFYRANDYFSFCLPLFVLVSIYENLCRRLRIRQLCSGFILFAERLDSDNITESFNQTTPNETTHHLTS